jgi:hypothetical protein
VCWRLSSRWREENYFRYARTRFALDALDCYAAAPDDPDRTVPNPARKTAAARIRQAEAAAQAAETARDAALLQLRSPAPGQAAAASGLFRPRSPSAAHTVVRRGVIVQRLGNGAAPPSAAPGTSSRAWPGLGGCDG